MRTCSFVGAGTISDGVSCTPTRAPASPSAAVPAGRRRRRRRGGRRRGRASRRVPLDAAPEEGHELGPRVLVAVGSPPPLGHSLGHSLGRRALPTAATGNGRDDAGSDQATSHLCHHLAALMRTLTALLCLCRTRRPRFGATRCVRSPGAAASTRRPCGSRRTSRRPPSCSSRGSSITGPAKCPPSPSRSWCEAGPELATLPSPLP